jgi:hypothetical protein
MPVESASTSLSASVPVASDNLGLILGICIPVGILSNFLIYIFSSCCCRFSYL